MRIYRRQRTLWRAGVVALLDIAVLCLAGLFATGSEEAVGPAAAYEIRTSAGKQAQVVPVTITIESDSTVYLDGIPTDLAGISSQLEDALRISGGNHVTIETAPGVPIAVVSAALEAAGAAGATSLALTATRSSGGG